MRLRLVEDADAPGANPNDAKDCWPSNTAARLTCDINLFGVIYCALSYSYYWADRQASSEYEVTVTVPGLFLHLEFPHDRPPASHLAPNQPPGL